MRKLTLAVALLLGLVVADEHSTCYVKKPNKILKTVVKSKLADVTPPEQWIWNDISGVNYLTNMKNQHIPQYCGSCWAQAATSVVSDRIKIARKAQWPDVNISP